MSGSLLPFAPLTSFVGRQAELADLRLRLPAARLLTLTGPGGVGKTRLALQLAALAEADFPDGSAFVPLADLRDPDLLLAAVARALGLSESGGDPLLGRLTDYLAPRRMLLLLDNLEQLLPAAPRVGALLAAAPRLSILCTSRSALQIGGEQEYPILPLDLPPEIEPRDDDPDPPRDDLASVGGYAAIQLFVVRVQAVRPGFGLSEANAPAVAAICRRLDGLPLAIELAAARMRALSVEALQERLARRLPLLTGGPRDAPERHRTLRAAIAWSYDLLPEGERRLLRRLGAFVGSAGLSGVRAVCAAPGQDELELLDQLQGLVAASLLRLIEGDEEPRYSMLETVREFAAELLAADPGEGRATRDAHIAYMRGLTERAGGELVGPRQQYWMARLELERANLRESLAQALGSGQVEAALAISGSIARFWWIRGASREGRDWIERAIAAARLAPADTPAFRPALAQAIRAAGFMAWAQADYEAARQRYAESLELFRDLGDAKGEAYALHNLGMIAAHMGELDEAEELYNESLRIKRGLGDIISIGATVNNLGYVAERRGDYETAYQRYMEAAEIERGCGDLSGTAQKLAHAGEALTRMGRYAEAHPIIAEGLRLARRVEALIIVIDALQSAAELAAAEGRTTRSVRLFAAVEALRRRHGSALPIDEYPRVVVPLMAARMELGAAGFAAEWLAGEAMGVDQAVDYALTPDQLPRLLAPLALPASPAPTLTIPARPAAEPAPLAEPLTDREREVLALLAEGLSNREIAERLVVSVYTVQSHVKAIFGKLGVATRAAATRAAIDRGLLG